MGGFFYGKGGVFYMGGVIYKYDPFDLGENGQVKLVSEVIESSNGSDPDKVEGVKKTESTGLVDMDGQVHFPDEVRPVTIERVPYA